MFPVLRVAAATLLVGVAPAVAQTVLTFDDVVARARDQAGPVAVARARVSEVEAGVVGASARFRDNPVLEAAAGPRRSGGGGGNGTIDIDIGLSQQFETGGQRRARLDSAGALVDRERAELARTSRAAVYEGAVAFLRGVAASDRERIAEEAAGVSRDLQAAMERRFAAGDVAAIDLNLTRIETARSTASLGAARADLAEAVGALRSVLRLPSGEPVALRGDLDVAPLTPLESLERLLVARPELMALSAEVADADAQVRLGRALSRPDLGIRMNYERDAQDTVVLGGFTVTLPSFQRGQGTLALGLAQGARARLESEVTRQTALAELRAAYEVHVLRAGLAEALAREALPNVTDNESLARRSYDAGELNLMAYLLVRRDALDTRTSIVERRLDAALSRLWVDYQSGGLR
jgi:outer membrane protein, heavy metal efflux system